MAPLDLSLYLVTGRKFLPPGKDYFESLEEALLGGVTVVQVREKNVDTGEFLEIATRTKKICHKHNVPVIINDRIDIALAMGADGVHLGQTDMPARIARELLPKNAILGISVNTEEQALAVVDEGLADYVGIGSVWQTGSKQLTSPTLGPRGVAQVLHKLVGSKLKAVAIGGIHPGNVLRTLYGAVSGIPGRPLDGVAVISAIVSSPEPRSVAQNLAGIVKPFLQDFHATNTLASPIYGVTEIVKGAAAILKQIKINSPLVHQITNNVTINQLANTTIALGGSPIMATSPEEMEDLSKIPGALLINFGTIKDRESMILAGRFANAQKKPVVFDPVGIGATTFRKEVGDILLNQWQASIIKGNAGEIAALSKSQEVLSRGVDSVGSGFSNPKQVVLELARRERCIIVMTGETDYISNGECVLKLSNGHSFLGSITGSGCMLGACIASFCGASSIEWSRSTSQSNNLQTKLVRGDMFFSAVGGVLALTIASEIAGSRRDVKGTGTFLPALIDELYNLTPDILEKMAKVEIL